LMTFQWNSRSLRHLLQRVLSVSGMEISWSLRVISKVQRRTLHSWECISVCFN